MLEGSLNIRNQYRTNDEHTYGVTASVMRTIYGAVKSGNSMKSIKEELLRWQLNFRDMGHEYELRIHKGTTSHHHMMHTIAEEVHRKSLDGLEYGQLFTVLSDCTTDRRQRHAIIVYVCFFDSWNRETVCKMVGLKQVVSGASAQNLLNIIMNILVESLGEARVKKGFFSFVADSAPVNMGSISGIAARLKDEELGLNPGLHIFKCSAHLANLAVDDSYRKEESLIFTEELIAEIHHFYSNSFKRSDELNIIADLYGMINHKVNLVHRQRWIASETQIIRNLVKSWFINVECFRSISQDPTRVATPADRITRSKAKVIHDKLLGKNWLLWIHVHLDIMELLKDFSESTQSRANNIIDLQFNHERLLAKLFSLIPDDGLTKKVGRLLRNARLNDRLEWGVPSVREFLNTQNIIRYDGRHNMVTGESSLENAFILLNDEDARVQFSVFRARKMVQNLIQSFRNRFEFEKSLQLFHPLVWTFDSHDDQQEFFDRHLPIPSMMYKYTGNTVAEFRSQWSTLSLAIKNHTDFQNHLCRGSVIHFWSHFLNINTLPWTPPLRTVLEGILSVPISNAESERGFSALTRASSSRHKTVFDTYEKLLTIQLNGPGVSHFDAITAAKNWHLDNHRLADAVPYKKTKNIPCDPDDSSCEDWDDELPPDEPDLDE